MCIRRGRRGREGEEGKGRRGDKERGRRSDDGKRGKGEVASSRLPSVVGVVGLGFLWERLCEEENEIP